MTLFPNPRGWVPLIPTVLTDDFGMRIQVAPTQKLVDQADVLDVVLCNSDSWNSLIDLELRDGND